MIEKVSYFRQLFKTVNWLVPELTSSFLTLSLGTTKPNAYILSIAVMGKN